MAIPNSPTIHWLLTDHLNSLRLVLPLSRRRESAVPHSTRRLTSSARYPILFTSREFDAETGLYYNRARYLDPTTGRWTTQDPLGFAAGDANLYRYVGNRATLSTDPSGYLEQPPLWARFVNSLDAVLGNQHTGWFAQASNFSAGMGDTVSFGGTRRFRQWVGYDDVVDYTSTAYHVGNYAGTAVQIGFVLTPYGWVYFAGGSPLIVGNAVDGVVAYQALGVELGPSVVMGIASNLPVLNSGVSVFELWDGVSLRPGQGFGQPLDGWGYADRVVGMALDLVIVGRVGYSMTRPRPQTPAAPQVAPNKPFNRVPPEQPPFDPSGTLGAAKAWTMKGRLKHAQLPTTGKIRYVPPEGHPPSQPLPRGPNGGYLDRFGNEWTKGPSRTAGQPFEWDVQIGRNATPGFRALSRDGKHVNVSLDGEVTH